MTDVVRVYSKPACQQCTLTKRLLTNLGVEYIEDDATEPGNIAAFKEAGFMAAPVVVGGEEMWAGFQPERIKAVAARLGKDN